MMRKTVSISVSVSANLRMPLDSNIAVRMRVNNGETNEKHVSLGVGERTQSVVVFL